MFSNYAMQQSLRLGTPATPEEFPEDYLEFCADNDIEPDSDHFHEWFVSTL